MILGTWNLSSNHGSRVFPKISLLKSVIVYNNISSLTPKPHVPSNWVETWHRWRCKPAYVRRLYWDKRTWRSADRCSTVPERKILVHQTSRSEGCDHLFVFFDGFGSQEQKYRFFSMFMECLLMLTIEVNHMCRVVQVNILQLEQLILFLPKTTACVEKSLRSHKSISHAEKRPTFQLLGGYTGSIFAFV